MLSENVRKILVSQGWNEDRDVYDTLLLSDRKRIFSESKKVISSFGLLKIEYMGKHQNETLYFDVDDSIRSKDLRANIHGYDSFGQPGLDQECDWNEFEDYELTVVAEKYIGLPCCRIGYLEEYVGFEIYIAKDGSVWLAHSDIPEKSSDSFLEYLNQTICGEIEKNT